MEQAMPHLATWGLLASVVGGLSACSSSPSDSDRTCQQATPLRVCVDAGSTLRGVDVSLYQASVDWVQVRAAGVTFGFARISDGTANPDPDFVANWRGMLQSGIVRGAYQYFRAGVDPIAQANLVATSLQKAGGIHAGDLPVVMDIETADGQPESTIEANMRTWLAAVEAQTARTPMIYTSAGTYPVTTAAFAAYPLWVANYGVVCPSLPTGWSQWRFWQASSTGTIHGIGGPVDLDEYPGALDDLMGITGAAPSDSGAPAPMDDGGGHSNHVGQASDGASILGEGGPMPAGGALDGGGAAMGQAGKAGTPTADASSRPCGP
jgi:lysozyme